MNFLFWCEFPERIDFLKLNEFFKKNNFQADIGITCKSREDYEMKKISINRLSNLNVIRAWPVLPMKEGYWFSAQSSKKSIDSLDQYAGLPIKLDIEPPIPIVKSYKSNQIKMNLWVLKQLFMKGKNNAYLKNKLLHLSKNTDIMLSTFSLPTPFLKNLGLVVDRRFKYNFIHYSSFCPKFLRPTYNYLMKSFIKKRLMFDSKTNFAVGLITPGIFKDEPCYKTHSELKNDISFLKSQGVKNIVVFRLGSFLEHKHADKFLKVISGFKK